MVFIREFGNKLRARRWLTAPLTASAKYCLRQRVGQGEEARTSVPGGDLSGGWEWAWKSSQSNGGYSAGRPRGCALRKFQEDAIGWRRWANASWKLTALPALSQNNCSKCHHRAALACPAMICLPLGATRSRCQCVPGIKKLGRVFFYFFLSWSVVLVKSWWVSSRRPKPISAPCQSCLILQHILLVISHSCDL